ncbi:GNAT family N-acetyltransferase [Desulfosarcina ovata]|nr:GNAT family N-acetyltransferase [Desulfosarcina ovata]
MALKQQKKSVQMNIQIKTECTDIDWGTVPEILKSVGMAHYSPEKHRQAFEASCCTIFLYDGEDLIGFGRAISDGAYQAVVYDVAILEKYQGHGFGKRIIQEILSRVSNCHVILYASPGKEGFYEKYGFRRMKTGMASFLNKDAMAKRGFTE